MAPVLTANSPEWYAARGKYVGASEVAALFGCHPYISYFELWHRKAGNIQERMLDKQEAIQKGRFLENGVAEWVAWREGYRISQHARMVFHRRIPGWSATPDFSIGAPHRAGVGCLEIKVTGFVEDDECPVHWQIQLQSQLACTARGWGAVGALSTVPRTHLLTWEMERNELAITRIGEAIQRFWVSIEEGREPAPDYAEHADLIRQLHPVHKVNKVVDLTGDNSLGDLCARYLVAQQTEKAAQLEREQLRAEILDRIEDAHIAHAPGHRIKSKMIRASPPETLNALDIGRVLPGRAAFRALMIKEIDHV